MLRIGLALSGGGFRATLYHLGVVRYLKDVNLLGSVSHITSVSGGSVLAAHLVLNWDRYNGSADEFDEVAREIVDFVRLDVRNRILRRYPFTLACSTAQRIAQRRPWREFTRTGLLEGHYRKFLFGDTCLSQLPARPELHILSTNLSEGGLCSFTRNGLLVEERTKTGGISMRCHRGGLVTIPMAVAASSAFPGFFPPVELSAGDVGATEGEFQTQFFTDGGVYDNLGVRMFRYLERQQTSAIVAGDFVDLPSAVAAWNQSAIADHPSALGRVAEIYASTLNGRDEGRQAVVVSDSRALMDRLQQVIDGTDLAADSQLKALLRRDRPHAAAHAEGREHAEQGGNGRGGNGYGGNGHADQGQEDQGYEARRHGGRGFGRRGYGNREYGHDGHEGAGGNEYDYGELHEAEERVEAPWQGQGGQGRHRLANSLAAGDRKVRNRILLSAAFGQSAGGTSLRVASRKFDAVIASDAGKKFQVTRPDQASSFLRTAMRSSDILMDRVWQLETEHFANSTGYVLTPITKVVASEDDGTALHPEVQVQVSRIRTDMDRFHDREISGLVRHGYCVARHAVPRRECLASFSHEGEPWDPVGSSRHREGGAAHRRSWRGARATPEISEARQLQRSSRRRLLNMSSAWRDWISYCYLPLLILLLGVIPFQLYRMYRHAHVASTLTRAIAETRQDYERLLELIEYGPVESWPPMAFVEAERLDPLLAEQGLDIISDTRITDLRNLDVGESGERRAKGSYVYVYRLVSIRKTSHSEGSTGLCLQSLWDMPNLVVRCHNPDLHPVLLRCRLDKNPADDDFKMAGDAAGGRASGDGGRYAWQLQLDFRKVPVGRTVDVVLEAIVPSNPDSLTDELRDWWRFEVDANPEVTTAWVLLPDAWRNRSARLVRYENASPDVQDLVEPTHQAFIRGGSILNWTIVHPKADSTYTFRWDREI